MRDQVAENLATAEARNELADVQDQIEDRRAAFQPLTEIAERYQLDLYEADVTSGGTELTVIPNLATEDAPRVTQAIFKAEQGALTLKMCAPDYHLIAPDEMRRDGERAAEIESLLSQRMERWVSLEEKT